MNVGTPPVLAHSWLLLIHQLPAKPAYLRVKIWRRLQGVGAIAVKNAVHVLPMNEETQEDFEWLSGRSADEQTRSLEPTREFHEHEADLGRDLSQRAMEAAARGLAARSVRGVAAGRGAELRRSRRPDRGHASHSGRGETLGLGAAISARAELLHAATGPRGATAGDLYRLADASHARRHHRRRAFHRPWHRRHHGAELCLCRHSYHIDFGAKAASYVDTFMDVIRWDNVEGLF